MQNSSNNNKINWLSVALLYADRDVIEEYFSPY